MSRQLELRRKQREELAKRRGITKALRKQRRVELQNIAARKQEKQYQNTNTQVTQKINQLEGKLKSLLAEKERGKGGLMSRRRRGEIQIQTSEINAELGVLREAKSILLSGRNIPGGWEEVQRIAKSAGKEKRKFQKSKIERAKTNRKNRAEEQKFREKAKKEGLKVIRERDPKTGNVTGRLLTIPKEQRGGVQKFEGGFATTDSKGNLRAFNNQGKELPLISTNTGPQVVVNGKQQTVPQNMTLDPSKLQSKASSLDLKNNNVSKALGRIGSTKQLQKLKTTAQRDVKKLETQIQSATNRIQQRNNRLKQIDQEIAKGKLTPQLKAERNKLVKQTGSVTTDTLRVLRDNLFLAAINTGLATGPFLNALAKQPIATLAALPANVRDTVRQDYRRLTSGDPLEFGKVGTTYTSEFLLGAAVGKGVGTVGRGLKKNLQVATKLVPEYFDDLARRTRVPKPIAGSLAKGSKARKKLDVIIQKTIQRSGFEPQLKKAQLRIRKTKLATERRLAKIKQNIKTKKQIKSTSKARRKRLDEIGKQNKQKITAYKKTLQTRIKLKRKLQVKERTLTKKKDYKGTAKLLEGIADNAADIKTNKFLLEYFERGGKLTTNQANIIRRIAKNEIRNQLSLNPQYQKLRLAAAIKSQNRIDRLITRKTILTTQQYIKKIKVTINNAIKKVLTSKRIQGFIDRLKKNPSFRVKRKIVKTKKGLVAKTLVKQVDYKKILKKYESTARKQGELIATAILKKRKIPTSSTKAKIFIEGVGKIAADRIKKVKFYTETEKFLRKPIGKKPKRISITNIKTSVRRRILSSKALKNRRERLFKELKGLEKPKTKKVKKRTNKRRGAYLKKRKAEMKKRGKTLPKKLRVTKYKQLPRQTDYKQILKRADESLDKLTDRVIEVYKKRGVNIYGKNNIAAARKTIKTRLQKKFRQTKFYKEVKKVSEIQAIGKKTGRISRKDKRFITKLKGLYEKKKIKGKLERINNQLAKGITNLKILSEKAKVLTPSNKKIQQLIKQKAIEQRIKRYKISEAARRIKIVDPKAIARTKNTQRLKQEIGKLLDEIALKRNTQLKDTYYQTFRTVMKRRITEDVKKGNTKSLRILLSEVKKSRGLLEVKKDLPDIKLTRIGEGTTPKNVELKNFKGTPKKGEYQLPKKNGKLQLEVKQIPKTQEANIVLNGQKSATVLLKKTKKAKTKKARIIKQEYKVVSIQKKKFDLKPLLLYATQSLAINAAKAVPKTKLATIKTFSNAQISKFIPLQSHKNEYKTLQSLGSQYAFDTAAAFKKAFITQAKLTSKGRLKLKSVKTTKKKKPVRRITKKVVQKKAKSKGLQGYGVLVRSRGKIRQLNKRPLSLNGAQDYMAFVLDNKLVRTGKIKPLGKFDSLGKAPKKARGYYQKTKKKYRNFRVKQKKKVAVSTRRIIEKRKYVGDKRGEQRNLARSRAKKAKSIKRKVPKRKVSQKKTQKKVTKKRITKKTTRRKSAKKKR